MTQPCQNKLEDPQKNSPLRIFDIFPLSKVEETFCTLCLYTNFWTEASTCPFPVRQNRRCIDCLNLLGISIGITVRVTYTQIWPRSVRPSIQIIVRRHPIRKYPVSARSSRIGSGGVWRNV